MQALIELIRCNQAFLLKSTLAYAKQHGYTRYTSPQEKDWIESVAGLSEAIVKAAQQACGAVDVDADDDFQNKSLTSFGMIEARRHRSRGVRLDMFLGLMKYYRQSYLDLIDQQIPDAAVKKACHVWICRFFDLNEIGLCTEWASTPADTMLSELQLTNRETVSAKNKYLTLFENMPTPAILLDTENRCVNMNGAAQSLLNDSSAGMDDAAPAKPPEFSEAVPWLREDFAGHLAGNSTVTTVEKGIESPAQGKRDLVVKFRRMVDISGGFEGTVVLIDDITDRKRIEDQLRVLSFHDALTGLYNRAYLDEEITKMSAGRFDPVGIITIDVDGLKLVNDNLGHGAGDKLLVSVAGILKNCFRQCDVVARSGGDEFSILLPSSAPETVYQACARIRNKVLEHNMLCPNMPISVSIGWAVGDLCGKSMQEIIREADKRMYVEKQTNSPKYAESFMGTLRKQSDQVSGIPKRGHEN